MVFLELHQEPGIYSHLMAGMALQKSCMFSDIRTPVYLRGTARDSPQGMEAQQGPLSRGAGDPTQGSFLTATGILGFLSIFKRSQPSFNFEAFISA